MKGWLLLLSSSMLGFISAGCAIEDTEEIIEKAVEAQENLNSYYAEVTSTYMFNDEQEEMAYKEWHVKPNKHRMEMDEGHIYVSNGEQSWSYNAQDNTVIVYEESADLSEEMPDETDMIRDMLTEMMNSNEVLATGTETIADRSTIHLTLTPDNDEVESQFNGLYEIWIDEETYMPLKMIWEEDGFRSEMVYDYVEFNVELNHDLFTFDIPDGASIQTIDDYMPTSLSLTELDNQTNYEVPELTYLPKDFELENALYLSDIEESILEYTNSAGDYFMLSIFQDRNDAHFNDEESSEEVEVGRYKGQYSDMMGTHLLSWDTGPYQLQLISSTDSISKKELMQIAEGIE
ncbi:hypothetical protein CR194_17490 [Salipaludibacillus keqinensis]|uniref:DUF4367 domain-containing protein n=1 Tax=Salipaludibacillus keqinensis TaxID=2045207 RepID=A0A323T8H1_9BACI|nr:outer membrane lipoprotein-sorting protein [Salipaludibacillus keqinensis]PYZ91991.1 hypothetical protein CR194_17490 [Salipaludibacillus keqinensis]